MNTATCVESRKNATIGGIMVAVGVIGIVAMSVLLILVYTGCTVSAMIYDEIYPWGGVPIIICASAASIIVGGAITWIEKKRCTAI